ELEQRIERLNRKKFSYPDEVTRVTEAIREEFIRIGRKAEPKVLCELLEITDDTWRNAVEGYLNTQRFYILVEPEHFDIALGTYDRLRKERKAYGVGLINTQKLDAYDTAPEDSLATVVSSGNVYAKRFINMVLGKVHMCSHYRELKNYPTSITKECMKYQNHVASAIKPAIYETPYIGSNAIKIQLEQAKEKREELKEALRQLEERLKQLEFVMAPLATDADTDIKYRVDVLSELWALEEEIKRCNDNITTLEKNSNMIQKQIQLDALEKLLKELEGDHDRLNREIGGTQEKIRKTNEEITMLQAEYASEKTEYLELGANAGEQLIIWNHDYEKQTSDKTFEQFRDNFARRKKANLTTVEASMKNMEKAMVEYKTAHDFGAAPTMEGYPDFAGEYDKLKNSELLSYEEKVQSARNAAEEEFREQFLSKLQENMKTAQSEFKELNKALNDIIFSNEKYEFIFMPSRRYRQYYEMIMDDFNAMQGESIFSGLFHENHKEVIDELFEKLALDNENNVKALDEFTDYRTYMDYDIKIIHSDGNYSFYSKVCEEKSGGETQTPFYVTVAASFVQLYKNNIGGEAIGLVMFDEAFNNMDDERIGGVLEFLRRLPLQIIIAAPPDKIQYISPYVEETLLVMTDEKVSFVENYHIDAV
ncbi:MAG: SbcC/MukB-like Walker B domain-containing protein, partial [Lachnospiraceae bacterium]|nr:SbcC/MukB-like Walker B domain-containing protein [Lachnospiraceae bacterium]